jgi:hypothetical protein
LGRTISTPLSSEFAGLDLEHLIKPSQCCFIKKARISASGIMFEEAMICQRGAFFKGIRDRCDSARGAPIYGKCFRTHRGHAFFPASALGTPPYKGL